MGSTFTRFKHIYPIKSVLNRTLRKELNLENDRFWFLHQVPGGNFRKEVEELWCALDYPFVFQLWIFFFSLSTIDNIDNCTLSILGRNGWNQQFQKTSPYDTYPLTGSGKECIIYAIVRPAKWVKWQRVGNLKNWWVHNTYTTQVLTQERSGEQVAQAQNRHSTRLWELPHGAVDPTGLVGRRTDFVYRCMWPIFIFP